MTTTSFTVRIDVNMTYEFEVIGRIEDRSASWRANQARRNFVEEKMVTRELMSAGLALIERGSEGFGCEALHEWLAADDERTFPGATSEDI